MKNKCFEHNTHISNYGFNSLISGTASEMQRLEMAEHLSFCDECTDKYVEMLTNDKLMNTKVSVKKNVMQRIHGKIYKALINKYTIYASAACIAFMMWTSGILSYIPQFTNSVDEYLVKSYTQQYEQRYTQNEREPIMQNVGKTLSNAITSLFK